MKLLRLAAFAAVVSLAACTSSPTESARTDAVNASFDGGNTLGSGYSAGEQGPGMLGSGTESTSDGGNGLGSGNVQSDTTSAGRGGNGLGSGN